MGLLLGGQIDDEKDPAEVGGFGISIEQSSRYPKRPERVRHAVLGDG